LRFDFSYVGESEGKLEDLTISGEVEDLAGAWGFVRRRVAGAVGIIGSSLGGTVALLFAGEEAQVAAVATIAAVAVPGRRARRLAAAERARWRREGVYEIYGSRLRYAFLEDVERLDVPTVVKRLRCPLLVTHGTEDEVVPFADAKTLARCAGERCELIAYPLADHRFSDPVLLGRLLGDISAWMLRHLDAGAERSGRLVSHTG
jgi:dipeptidyl aminopeptidase/acylaminoacyl peptidase